MTQGKVTDYGDIIHVEQWLVKGRHYRFGWRISAPAETNSIDRAQPTQEPDQALHSGRIDTAMDLQADKKVTLSPSWSDEMGNPTSAPAGSTVSYTLTDEDPSGVLNLTDNGDGTAVAAAAGGLGRATVHAEASSDMGTASGDLLIVVVPGDAERFGITASEPEEVTPDNA